MITPDSSTTVTVTPVMEKLAYAIVLLLSALFTGLVWLITKLRPVFRHIDQHKWMWKTLRGTKDKPGLVTRQAQDRKLLRYLARRVATVWAILKLSDPEMKAQVAAQAMRERSTPNAPELENDPRAQSGYGVIQTRDLPPTALVSRGKRPTPFPTTYGIDDEEDDDGLELDDVADDVADDSGE